MAVSISALLGLFFSVQIGSFFRFGFSFIPNQLMSYLFGPVIGGLTEGLADLLKFLLKPQGFYFPGYTLNAILSGIISGIFLCKRPVSFYRILLSNIAIALFINSLLGTFWLSIMYKKGFLALFPARLFTQLITIPVNSFTFYYFIKIISNSKFLTQLKNIK